MKIRNFFSTKSPQSLLAIILLLPIGIIFSLLLLPLLMLDPKSRKFDKKEASVILRGYLETFRSMTIEQLKAEFADETKHCISKVGSNGVEYRIEVSEIWRGTITPSRWHRRRTA